MAKMFGKKITTEEQVKLYNEYKALFERRKQLIEEHREKFMIYWGMEGKHSVGKRKLYYKENIKPLDEEIEEIGPKLCAIEKTLCVALWGYSPRVYYHKQELITAKKELKQQRAYVERLKKELAELEEEEAF